MKVPRPAWRDEDGELVDGQELRELPDGLRQEQASGHPWADQWPTWIGL